MKEKALVTNASDEKQIKEAPIKQKLGRERELEDIKWVMSSRQGRRFLWRYLGQCRVYETSYSRSGSDVYFNEGMRQIGLMLLSDITEANPEKYIEMMKENKGEN